MTDGGERWQQTLVQRLAALLEGDEDVLLVGLRGSLLYPERVDSWSDVDVLLVVRQTALARFFPTLDWLAPLGPVFAYEQLDHGNRWTTRVCFDDFRRLDIALTTLTKLVEAKNQLQTLFPGESRLLISRSPAAADALGEPVGAPVASPPSLEEVQQMANSFWYKSVIAVVKIMRDDTLIATHLTLELVQECCVLGMILRDRAAGTSHHRSGRMGNEILTGLPSLRKPYSALRLLQAIKESGVLFDGLARECAEGYQPHFPNFEKFARSAEEELRGRTQ
ncbi:MAG: aminoglycoside 6-adenylyltransferase [Candidatus Promineifilaceae bacterium]|nr:aminoglycoside 6-adenylyltransferase [Candidatus Promineifilaceae bacterium]